LIIKALRDRVNVVLVAAHSSRFNEHVEFQTVEIELCADALSNPAIKPRQV
jgi:hypothetical protein